MPKPPSTRDSWLRLLEPSTSLEEVWAHLAELERDDSAAAAVTEDGERLLADHSPREPWKYALQRASEAVDHDARGLALHLAENLPPQGGSGLEAWVAEVVLERWHERVDGARLQLRGVDGDGVPLEAAFDQSWESSTLGLIAPAAMASFGDGLLLEIVLRLIASRVVIAAVEQLDPELLRAGASEPPTLWVSGDAPPAFRLGVWESDGWTSPPGWFD